MMYQLDIKSLDDEVLNWVLGIVCDLNSVCSGGAEDLSESHPLLTARIIPPNKYILQTLRQNNSRAILSYAQPLYEKLKQEKQSRFIKVA